jgi:acetylornithine deacetylase
MISPANLLEHLVATPSVSGEEQRIADLVQDLASGRGLRVERYRNNVVFRIGSGRFGSAAIPGPRLLLNSHLDTVPPGEGWTDDPFTPAWRDSRLHGLGANDAKGCVAAILSAAFLLAEHPPEGELVVALTAEEETGGQGLATILDRIGPLDAAVIGEPTGLQVCTAQRGLLVMRCTARGSGGHAAHAEAPGIENAIHKAARDISRVAAMRFPPHPLLGAAKPQVTQVGGGRQRNQVPDTCEFFVDLRTDPGQDHDGLAMMFRATLESEVAIHSKRYLPKGTDSRHPLVRAALAAAGAGSPVGSSTTSDWAFLGDVPAVKVGPGDTLRSHRPDEYLALAELEAGVAFYAQLVPSYFAALTREGAHHG